MAKGLSKTFASIKDEKDITVFRVGAAGGKCETCNYPVAKLKLDVNTRDQNGYAPVHHAALGGHIISSLSC